MVPGSGRPGYYRMHISDIDITFSHSILHSHTTNCRIIACFNNIVEKREKQYFARKKNARYQRLRDWNMQVSENGETARVSCSIGVGDNNSACNTAGAIQWVGCKRSPVTKKSYTYFA